MSKIFIFAFDGFSARGGMRDLVAILHEEGADRIGDDFLIKPAELVPLAVKHHRDIFEVVHFQENGGILLTEQWRKFISYPADRAKIIDLANGTFLALEEVVSDFSQLES